MKNWMTSAVAFALVVSLGWYSGTCYLARGPEQAKLIAGALCLSIWLHFYHELKLGRRGSRLSLRVRRQLWSLAVFVFVLANGWYAGV